MCHLGIDLGVSYTKICLIDNSGREKIIFRHRNHYLVENELFKEMEPVRLFGNITQSIKRIKIQDPDYFKNIKSISVTTHGCTFILLDKNDREITNFISVFDKRSGSEAEHLNSLISQEKNYRISGHRENSELYTATKLLWFKRNKKTIFNKIHKILFLEDYILYKLSGRFVTDKSIASISGMLDINKGTWREDIIDIVGINKSMLPDILDGGTVVGKICKNFAGLTGLNRNVVVVSGLLDAIANSVGAGNISFDKAVECTGTVLSIITNSRIPFFNNLKIPINYFINGNYSLLPFSPTAGIVLEWFGKNFYDKKDFYKKMENEISGNYPDESNPFFIPYFKDMSIVHGNIKSRGVIFGLELEHKKKDICKSLYESIAFILKENLIVLEKIKKIKFESVLSVGGASKSRQLSQLKSDILNKEVTVTRNKEAGCLGVAILAAVATNVYKNLQEAVENMVKISKVYRPDIEKNIIYEKRYKAYRKILGNLKNLFLNCYGKN